MILLKGIKGADSLAQLLTRHGRTPAGGHRPNRALRTVIKSYEEMLIQSGAVKIAPGLGDRFQLRNGSYSYVYVDHGDLICQPETNNVFVGAIGKYIKQQFAPDSTILVNVDSKASPQLTGAVAVAAKYRQIVVLPEATHREEQGLRLRIRLPATIGAHDKIVIVDDVLTPHDMTASRIAELVRDELNQRFDGSAANEVHLVVGLVRDPEVAVRGLSDSKIHVHWLTTLADLVHGVWPRLDSEQKQRLRDEFPLLSQQAEESELVSS
jgi:hypothetical protein